MQGMQVPQVLIVICPLQVGVNLYQTSGVLTELPHGVGIDPGVEGVAHIVEPQADGLLGVPIFTAMALGHKSFVGTVVVCCARMENQPTTLGPVPAWSAGSPFARNKPPQCRRMICAPTPLQ